MQTSISLLEQLRGPNEAAAWGRFVELCAPLMLAWARRLGLDDSAADDLIQEAFVVLVRKLPEFRYRQGESFRAWLKSVTCNKHREMRRRKALPMTDGAALDGVVDPGEEFWEADYRRHLMARALETSPRDFQPKTWRAFHEVVVAGRDPDEVAADLDVSVNAVYVARSRVVQHLRQELAGLLD